VEGLEQWVSDGAACQYTEVINLGPIPIFTASHYKSPHNGIEGHSDTTIQYLVLPWVISHAIKEVLMSSGVVSEERA